jgi:hypothetical protein
MVRLAQTRRFRARWTQQIHEEWVWALLSKNAGLDPAKLNRTVELINRAVPDCMVSGYEHLIDLTVAHRCRLTDGSVRRSRPSPRGIRQDNRTGGEVERVRTVWRVPRCTPGTLPSFRRLCQTKLTY